MSSSGNSKLDAIIAAYVEATERGAKPDRQQLLAVHPEHAEDLASFFADFDRMQATHLQENGTGSAGVCANFPAPQHAPKPGTLIGSRYKLLENIGEGGMGSVWVAEQKEPVKRKVAIKLVKAGMDSKQVLARFEAERQALAVMDHPNIAKVFDGGMTENGRPYFVMEYVKGVPFTEYCDKARLSLKERLSLFIPVCQAVQHAHHKGIVHRDLKPSNILICLYDGKPVPKVIDFGLAKAMNQSLTEHSIFTGHGVMVGTPLYMSPEQAEHNNLDVDTRTDIYSLGVVLYELLTGTTPLEREQLRTAAYNEILRLIKEVEPPRPSLRLSGSARLPSIAAQRSIDPRHLQKSLAGDLDWIVMKSLEKERSRRYETATGLARDVERFLADETVEACPPSLSYRLKKYIRRHRPQAIAVGLILCTLLVAIAATTWGWRTATDAADTVKKSLADVTTERDAKNEALSAEAAQRKLAEKNRDLAERQLIAGILRPIGSDKEPGAAELRCFVDWSQIPDARLKLKVLEVAFEDPAVALRVAWRGERSMQACVGVSPTRRAGVIELMAGIRHDLQDDPQLRIAAAWLMLELGSGDIPGLSEGLTRLSLTNPVRPEFQGLVDSIGRRVGTLNPAHVTLIGDAIILSLEQATDPAALKAAANGLVMLAPKLTPSQCKRGWDALISALKNTRDRDASNAAGRGLAELAKFLNAEDVAQGWNTLIGILEKSSGPTVLEAAGIGLVALVPKLSPDSTARVADSYIILLEKSSSGTVLVASGTGLAAIRAALSPDQVTRGWKALSGILQTSKDSEVLQAAATGLVTLAPLLMPEQFESAWDDLIGIVQRPKVVATNLAAGKGLVALASMPSPDQIQRCWEMLINILEKQPTNLNSEVAANGLAALAPKLSPEQITRSMNALLGVLDKSEYWGAVNAAGNSLIALVPQLRSEQVTRLCDAYIVVLEKAKNGYALQAAGRGLVALSPTLNAEQIAHCGDALSGILEKSKNSTVMREAGRGLTALATTITPQQMPRAVDALVGVIEKRPSGDALQVAVQGLVALAPKLSPDQIKQGADALIGVILKPGDPYGRAAAEDGIVALAPRLSPDQIVRGGNALISILETSLDRSDVRAASRYLVALAPMSSPDARVKTAELLIASLKQPDRLAVAELLLALKPHLERPTQDRIAAETMTLFLNDLAVSEDYFHGFGGIQLDPFRPAIMAIAESRSLSEYLQHPACIGEPREWMLQRFEELLFHNGERVFLPLPEVDSEESPTAEHGGLTSSRSPVEKPPRRFHTIYDAATWIQNNWPDSDLDATHPVTWRGER